ncbi:flagellar basal body rod protein FlgF [Oxalobacter vibrioformis]|uniref:Flagellar basal-body rod protein FlgF n=1 Tax=Oxalobacter vibrioformis TaxID=933080 RepID=A0A9E9LYF3_9BURK|nr:flagellar basal body rod protein FlgF [Oxalobacter vibrioformis]NLC24327.1 flagellar basal body rod protein FlgF [Oxalobacter sp.]WAW09528.1 flagellar basal body rod protein FlgF [Oxalobacter vibrioformis]
MDRLLYTAMTGAIHTMNQQATTSHNLANVTTTGFRAQVDSFRAVPVISEGSPTRDFVVDAEVGTDFRLGAIQQTGRILDVALINEGWLVIDMPDGSESYTRHGSLVTTPQGLLQTREGYNVKGLEGPIVLPTDIPYTIETDGTISAMDDTTTPRTVMVIGQLRLVNPPQDQLVRGTDGYFRMKDGTLPAFDPGVKLVNGSLEASNVNPAETLVNIISLARQFELQMNMIKHADENASRAIGILTLNG